MNVIYMWVLGIVFAFSATVAQAQAVHGVLRVVKGDVQIKSAKSGQTVKARMGEKVFPKDTVITGKDARAKIVMVDNNEINVSPESQIEIQNYEYDPAAGKKDVLLNVIYGKVRSKVEQKYDGKTTKFQIKTPSAVAGVRGTDFLTGFQGGMTNIVTFEGKVELGLPGPGGTIKNPVFVTPGTTASVSQGSGPTPPTAVPKDQLAKMDGETKAEGPKNDGSGANNDSRQPAADKKEEKKEDKKDSAKGDAKGEAKNDGKSGDGKGDGGDKNKGSGNDKNGNSGNKSGDSGGKSSGGGAGAGGTAASGGGDSGGSGGSSSGGRAPANDSSGSGKPGGGMAGPTGPSGGGMGAGPGPAAGGGCTMCGVPAGPVGGPIGPIDLPGGGPVVIVNPVANVPTGPVCGLECQAPIQSGNTKLIIKVNTGN